MQGKRSVYCLTRRHNQNREQFIYTISGSNRRFRCSFTKRKIYHALCSGIFLNNKSSKQLRTVASERPDKKKKTEKKGDF